MSVAVEVLHSMQTHGSTVFLVCAAAAAGLLAIHLLLFYLRSMRKALQLRPLPGPPGRPLLGNLLEYNSRRHAYVTECHRKYGRVIRLWRGTEPIVMVTDPTELAKLFNPKKGFCKAPTQWGVNPMLELSTKLMRMLSLGRTQPIMDVANLVQPQIGVSFNLEDDEAWHRNRRAVNPVFGPANVASRVGELAQLAQRQCEKWERMHAANPEEPIDVQMDIHDMTLDAVLSAVAGLRPEERADPLGKRMVRSFAQSMEFCASHFRAFKLSSMFVSLDYDRPLSATLHDAYYTVYDLVSRRLKEGPEKWNNIDMVSLMLKHLGPETNPHAITSTVTNLVIAGAESNASAIATTLYLMAQHPEVLRRAQQEVDEVLGGRPVEEASQLEQLQFLRQCYQEAMRMYPPATVVHRTAARDTELGGFFIPKGTVVGCCIAALHADAEVFPDPERYDPERFAPEAVAARPSFTYMPFSTGMRGCPGYRFATAEAMVALATVLQRFDLAADASRTSMRPLVKFVNWIADGVHLRVTPRQLG